MAYHRTSHGPENQAQEPDSRDMQNTGFAEPMSDGSGRCHEVEQVARHHWKRIARQWRYGFVCLLADASL
jgi:hypothetical protein